MVDLGVTSSLFYVSLGFIENDDFVDDEVVEVSQVKKTNKVDVSDDDTDSSDDESDNGLHPANSGRNAAKKHKPDVHFGSTLSVYARSPAFCASVLVRTDRPRLTGTITGSTTSFDELAALWAGGGGGGADGPLG